MSGLSIGFEGRTVPDDNKLYFGSDRDYSMRYDSASDKFVLRDEAGAFDALTIDSTGSITTNGDVSVGGALDTTGDATVGGALSTSGNVSVNGNIDTTGNVTIDGSIDMPSETGTFLTTVGYKMIVGNNTDKNIAIGRSLDEYGSNNVLIGVGASSNWGDMVTVGANAGNPTGNGQWDVCVGSEAGAGAEGSRSVFLGGRAGKNATGANSITALGSQALADSSAGNMVGVGELAGWNTGTNDAVFVGKQAGYNCSMTYRTVAVGYQAAEAATSGGDITALGYQAGHNYGAGSPATLLGSEAGEGGSGSYNIFIGKQAGNGNSGSNCIGIGYQALEGNTEDYRFVVTDDFGTNKFEVDLDTGQVQPKISGNATTPAIELNDTGVGLYTDGTNLYAVDSAGNATQLT